MEPSCIYMIDRSERRHDPRLNDPVLRTLADLDETLGPFEFKRQSSLYFDVPEGTEIAAVELHASCDSRGLRFSVQS